MAVYSEIYKNEEILNILDNKYDRVLLIGCGACMNESLAHLYDLPLSIRGDRDDILPIPIINELKRIAVMLEENGYRTEWKYIPEGSNSLCIIDTTKELYHISFGSEPEVVLLLSCPAGREGIKKTFEEIPVINITRQKGVLFYEKKDDGLGKREKGISKVIYFNKG